MESEQNNLPKKITSAEPRWLPYAIFVGITLILAVPILRHIHNWGVRDWDLFTTLHAAAVRSVVQYGQFPFWNPYIGGGNILFAHPEVPVLNPLFGLLLIFGPLIGLKIQMLVVYFIGLAGWYKLSRQLGISYHGALIPPLVYMLGSYLTLHFAAGHIPFHYFAVFPWVIFFYKKSLERPIHILSTGAAVAFIILGSGAAVPLLFILFFLFLFSLLDIDRKLTVRPPLYAVAAGVCGILFAAVKFFPMFDYLIRNPWLPERTVQTTPLWVVPIMLFSFDQSLFARHILGYMWGWHEYGAFVGPVAMLLVIIGAIRVRQNWRYLLLIGVSFILLFGSFLPPFSPWDLLHRLPGFESIRVPSRFILLALIAIAILAGRGMDVILSYAGRRRNLVAYGTAAVILGTHLAVCLPILGEAFTRQPQPIVYHEDFKQIIGDPNGMYASLMSNRGTIKAGWLSAYRQGRGIIDMSNRTWEWFAQQDAVVVENRRFSPNRIGFTIDVSQPDTLIVSQGYDPGWHRTGGGEVDSFVNLVALKVTPADKRVEIYYYPDYFTLGLWVSALSILTAIGIAIYLRLRQ
jgi:hypothetical protein